MFGKKIEVVTVETLVADLTAKVDALRSLSVQKDMEAAGISAEINAMEAQKTVAENDSKRAVSIADKLSALLF